MSQDEGPLCYDLTEFTGSKRDKERRVVVASYSVPKTEMFRALLSIGAGALIGVICLATGSVEVAVIAVLVVGGGMYWIMGDVVAQSGEKLQTSRVQALDASIGARTGRRRAKRNEVGTNYAASTFLIGATPMVSPEPYLIVPVAIENPMYRDQIIAEQSGRSRVAAGKREAE